MGKIVRVNTGKFFSHFPQIGQLGMSYGFSTIAFHKEQATPLTSKMGLVCEGLFLKKVGIMGNVYA